MSMDVLSSTDRIEDVVGQAQQIFEAHYKDPAFLDAVRNEKFAYTSDTADKVVQKILASDGKFTVTYFYKRFSKCIANTNYAKRTIEFNKYHFDLRQTDQQLIRDKVVTFMHEYMHILGYKHKGNRNTPFNEGTVPYKVSRLFGEYIDKEKLIPLAKL